MNIYIPVTNIQEMTAETRQLYIDTLCDLFRNAEEDEFTTDDICCILKSYATQEYEKRKADLTKLSFGKYKMKSVSDVIKFDRQYLVWLVQQDMMTKSYPDLKKSIQQTLLATA